MRVKAITFDVGGTLIKPWPSVGHVYAEVASRHEVKTISANLLEARFHEVWPRRLHLTESRAGWEQLVDEVFAGLVEIPPSQTFFPELYERFARPDAWRIYDDVLPAFERLKSEGLWLAVISNWDERLRELLRRLQLDAYFETIVVSCEVGCAKPEPKIFARAARELSLPPGAILHVGDNADMDLAGAKGAGFHALRIHRDASESGDDHIRSMLELPKRIRLAGKFR